MVTPVLALWIFGSAVEVPLVHVLVPWDGARIPLLILGAWGLTWMVGFLAGLRSYPHLLDADALRVRNGPMHDIAVPLAEIAQVTTSEKSLPSSMWVLQPERTGDGLRLNVTVSGTGERAPHAAAATGRPHAQGPHDHHRTELLGRRATSGRRTPERQRQHPAVTGASANSGVRLPAPPGRCARRGTTASGPRACRRLLTGTSASARR
jgi:hypothetical protein